MKSIKHKTLNLLILFPLSASFGHVLADETDNWGPNYTPPKTPALHEPSSLDKSRDPNMSKIYLGVTGALGQSRSTEKGTDAGVGATGGFDVGYIQNTTHFGRYSFGLEGLLGSLAFKDADVKSETSLNYAVVFKGTYGYSISGGVMGEMKAGLGFASADVEFKGDGYTTKTEEAASGMAYVLGYDVIMPVSNSLEFLVGFSWTHYSFDLGKVKTTNDDGTVASGTIDSNFLINHPKIEVGLRYLI